jgi:hypothetical protein
MYVQLSIHRATKTASRIIIIIIIIIRLLKSCYLQGAKVELIMSAGSALSNNTCGVVKLTEFGRERKEEGTPHYTTVYFRN